MQKNRRLAALIATTLALALTVAPAAEAKKKKKKKTEIVPSGFLGDYSDLQPDDERADLLVYTRGDGSLRDYRRFVVETPLIFFHPEARGVGVDPADLAMLSDHLRSVLVDALEKDGAYQVVDEPGEGVALLRSAITDVVPVDPRKNLATKTAGLAVGVGLLVPRVDLGSAAVEAEIVDSVGGERFAAVAAARQARRYGGVIKGAKEWGDAKAAFGSWAKELRKRLDRLNDETR